MAGQRGVFVLKGDGDGNLTQTQFSDVSVEPSSQRLGDFDGDGRDDLAVVFDDQYATSIEVYASTGDGGFAPARGKALRDDFHPVIVEAHAIDDGAIFAQTIKTWTWVAGLRSRRNRSALDETETEIEHRIWHLGVLVEARRQANRVGKVATEGANRKSGIDRAVGRQQGSKGPNQANRRPMGGFGRKKPQNRGRGIQNHDFPSRPDGEGSGNS